MQGKMQVLRSFALIFTLLHSAYAVRQLLRDYRYIFPENAVPADPPSNAGSA